MLTLCLIFPRRFSLRVPIRRDLVCVRDPKKNQIRDRVVLHTQNDASRRVGGGEISLCSKYLIPHRSREPLSPCLPLPSSHTQVLSNIMAAMTSAAAMPVSRTANFAPRRTASARVVRRGVIASAAPRGEFFFFKISPPFHDVSRDLPSTPFFFFRPSRLPFHLPLAPPAAARERS